MFDVFIMDMGGHDENVKQLLLKLPHAHTMRYMTSHLEMVKRAAARSKTELFWLIASCCDYVNFDFDYIPARWEQDQIHCWASGAQKFGDTFLINVEAWHKQFYIEKLEWYKDINWHSNEVKRLSWQNNIVMNDMVQHIKEHTFNSVYEKFSLIDSEASMNFDVNLWETRDIVSYNTGHIVLCPRDVKGYLKTQLYDYPYITALQDLTATEKPCDIVFLSYDEENAESNWNRLKQKFSRAERIHGINGMLAALKEAANIATTPYFYAVFAKTEVDDNFNFDFQPDYLKEKSNFVFRAYNPVLDCSYGHGSIVLYNTEWMKNIESYEGDLTMSLPVVSVPILSCTNNFDETPWSAWRTAFREVYKLHNKENRSVEDDYHLHLWLISDRGKNGKWSKFGAIHATEITINSTKLNDWDWLKAEFNSCYERNQ